MNHTSIALSALLLVPVIGLLTWLYIALTRVNEELRAFSGFDGLHFEVATADHDHQESGSASLSEPVQLRRRQ